MEEAKERSLNFIEEIIENDLKTGKHKEILTRFPPHPNGYLHIGHSKAICTSFGLAEKYGGKTNLRFDDTNPEKESQEYIDSIKKDIEWLGFEWENELYASDYFQQLYDWAIKLIQDGKAYVDDSTAEEIAAMKGTPTTPGTNSPFRDRSVEENLDLFQKMNEGAFEPGSKVLRAKIDMAAPNMHMRDPLMYRIKNVTHHRTGDKWKVYPMYDWAHGQSDSIENITHSLCSLEFEVHRPLYNWFIEQLGIYPSRQIEFARLNLNYTVMSKRKLIQLVEDGHVKGWDDPRMPTISGIRRRGFTPESIRVFNEKVGLAKRNNVIDFALLESCIREDLNKKAIRVMVVTDPVKLVITNYPIGKTETLSGVNNPEDPTYGNRDIPFSREIYIEREDFKEEPQNRKYFRLAPGKDVRLKHAYIIHCESFVKDDSGKITEIHCTYYPDSKSGSDTSGVKAKGTLHWVNVDTAVDVEVRIYDRLFKVESPDKGEGDFKDFINENSLEIKPEAKAEPFINLADFDMKYQFLRKGYYSLDPDSTADKKVFNRTVTLKDSWGKMQNK
ncbi:MAG: glutamine--tRNA ligase/YqeY domain fusion protein [Flavobacteriales bacterium]|nr:glutamine--tRNA ligase/YqeY domain fusion protein [Flavobacteriales bacterium]